MDLSSQIIAEAETWLGTPYHVNAAVKGVGADCGRWIAAVYRKAGVLEFEPTEHWPGDWYFHAREERYLDLLTKLMEEVSSPEPGGVALFKVGKLFAHAALIVEWPGLIHVWRVNEVIQKARADQWPLVKREVKWFRVRATAGLP